MGPASDQWSGRDHGWSHREGALLTLEANSACLLSPPLPDDIGTLLMVIVLIQLLDSLAPGRVVKFMVELLGTTSNDSIDYTRYQKHYIVRRDQVRTHNNNGVP